MKRRINKWTSLTLFGWHVRCEKKLWTLPSRAAFEAPHHSYHGGEACATKRSTVELQSHVFFPPSYLFFFLEKYASHCKIKKKTKKFEYLFVESNEVLIILITIYLILNPLLIFFNFIHLHLIFISNLVLIFLLIYYFFLSYS
jgi:hypothetical protein